MSGKDDSGLLSATMLQKARSFRDDIKMKIRRSPSHNRDSRSSVTSSGSHKANASSHKANASGHKSPKHKRKFSRGTSFKEESKSEKHVTKTDIERLETESKKVDHALLGLKVVVDGGWLYMLHGSATVVLEAVMEFKQLVQSLVSNRESTVLTSACRQVDTSLASLIQWADKVLLHGDGALDTASAESVIKSVNDAVKELHKISVEKLTNRCAPHGQSPRAKTPARKLNSYDSSIQQTPLPLTPREKEILDNTSHFRYDANDSTQSGEAGVNSGGESRRNGSDAIPAAAPPPKPPLPPEREPGLLAQSIQKAVEKAYAKQPHDGGSAPPLPPKKRTPSMASIYDNHIPDVDSPPQSPVPHNIAHTQDPNAPRAYNLGPATNEAPTSFLFQAAAGAGGSQTASPQTFSDSAYSCNIGHSGVAARATPSPVATLQTSRTSPKRTIPIHVQTDDSPRRQEPSRTSPGRVVTVSSVNSRASSFSVTTSSSATSQTIVYPTGPECSGSDVTAAKEREPPAPSGIRHAVMTSSRQEHVSHVSASRTLVSGGGVAVGGPHVAVEDNLRAVNDDSSRLSQYDNFDKLIREHQNEQFQNLTDQIKQLTLGVDTATEDLHRDFGIPPLPEKTKPSSASSTIMMQRARQRLVNRPTMMSQYDNFGAQPNVVTVEKQQARAESAEVSAVLRGGRDSPVVMRGSRSAYEFAAHKSATGNGYSHHQQTTVMKSSQTFAAVGNFEGSELGQDVLINPPPLPPKRKNVESYMQIFGATAPSFSDLARRSIHAVAHYRSQWMQHQLELHPMLSVTREWAEHVHSQMPVTLQLANQQADSSSYRSHALSMTSDGSSGRGSDVFSLQSGSSDDTGAQLTPPFPPKIPDKKSRGGRQSSVSAFGDMTSEEGNDMQTGSNALVPVDAQKRKQGEEEQREKEKITQPLAITSLDHKMDSGFAELTVLDDTDVSDQLIKNEPGSDEPEIRGGSVDALIVHAASVGVKEILYQEAFLTTYRTFISPQELIEKLLYRYNRFSQLENIKKKKLASAAFSLLIRVVDEMCTEISDSVLKVLTDTVYQFLAEGSLMLAKVLRRKIVEKVALKRHLAESGAHHLTLWEAHHMTTKQYSLLDFHARHIAEQMTLLDAELFQKIEIPEVLQWPQYQNEEQSPHLAQFTVHFNKMSYWCRTLILSQEDPREREKILLKFIKIMKHLRRYNNFNSYLAILSAVDSAPIRRLEWQKQNVEALKEFCQLIDSSSSFRAYRQSLAEAEPPCIPYIGIILQDLTFVHIGNPDKLEDGHINFSKRWQQFHILDNMKRFKKCQYEFKKDHKIVAFFDDFDHSLSEESLWQISEDIKPRGGGKKKGK